MIRFLADVNLNHAIIKGCRRQEPTLDFLSSAEAKLHGLADPEVLLIAKQQDRILVTHDFQTMPRHYGEFLNKHGDSPGVFLVSQNTPIGSVIDEIVLVWAASDPI